MKSFPPGMGLVLVAALASVSCDKFKPPAPEMQNPPARSGQARAQEGERTAFAQAAQKELDDLKVTIAELRARAEASTTQTRARLREEVKKLEADLGEAQQRLTELKAATVESWNQMKESFSRSVDRLKRGVEDFRRNAA